MAHKSKMKSQKQYFSILYAITATFQQTIIGDLKPLNTVHIKYHSLILHIYT